MKKTFNFYVTFWAVLLVLFNVIAFLPAGWAEAEKYTPSFWIGYVFITLAFIGQIVCAYFALRDSDIKKTFYNISLITTSYMGLILSFIFAALCMLISLLPYRNCIILCAIVLGLNAIAVIKATAAIEFVSSVDEKINANTLFVKALKNDSESLMLRAKSEVVKADCKKVYEAVRYSDPVSNGALASVEGEITGKFAKLSDAVVADNFIITAELSDELVVLIDDRNRKCKLLK